MTYTSLSYFALVGIVGLAYFMLPKKIRWVVLLLGSYAFYYVSAGLKAIAFLSVTTVSIFLAALLIGKQIQKQKKYIDTIVGKDEKVKARKRFTARKRLILLAGLLINFGILAVLKYSGFAVLGLNDLLDTNIGVPSFLLPLGLSFYTFQATGYVIDVYRGKTKPDRNIFKFALFVSFFPQVVQGPISRHDQLAHQLYAGNGLEWTRAKHGAELMLWGLFKKLVIADRAVMFVDYALENSASLQGLETAAGCLMFMAYIYADFSGGIDISRGLCQILGIDLMENFTRPYFATSLSDYWRRWHISLGTWMRDYLFYPLSLSKGFGKMGRALRKGLGAYWGRAIPACLATGITFFIVGIWHGAAWQYVIFGAYNASVIMIETLFAERISQWNKKHGLVKTKALSWRVFITLITFFLIFIGKFLSMAHGASHAIAMIKSTFSTFNPGILLDGTLYHMGLTEASFKLLLLALLVLFVVSLLQENGIKIREALDRQNIVFRWIIYIAAVFAILIFGVYGPGVDESAFVYQQF